MDPGWFIPDPGSSLLSIQDPGSRINLKEVTSNIMDPGWFIPDPGSSLLSIQDPGSQIPNPQHGNKKGEKIYCFSSFVASTFTKLRTILLLKR
jgi:hypothetical protein